MLENAAETQKKKLSDWMRGVLLENAKKCLEAAAESRIHRSIMISVLNAATEGLGVYSVSEAARYAKMPRRRSVAGFSRQAIARFVVAILMPAKRRRCHFWILSKPWRSAPCAWIMVCLWVPFAKQLRLLRNSTKRITFSRGKTIEP